ncbi:hypothetical protein [Priestia megaterium]|uniref:hypothetical protein n=1 Tax=Priestia megaterium TaxID=1404 RepID=UPI00372D5DEF
MKKFNLLGKVTYVLGAFLFLMGFVVLIHKVDYFALVPNLSVAIKYQIVGFILIVATETGILPVKN